MREEIVLEFDPGTFISSTYTSISKISCEDEKTKKEEPALLVNPKPSRSMD